MTDTDILTRTREGRVYRLALLNVYAGRKRQPVGHNNPNPDPTGICAFCLLDVIFKDEVMNRGRLKSVSRTRALTMSLYTDFAEAIERSGVPQDVAVLLSVYTPPLLINHLRPAEYRWMWLREDGRHAFPVSPQEQHRISNEMAAHDRVEPFWDEPIVLPEGVRRCRAKANSVDWGRDRFAWLPDMLAQAPQQRHAS